jgi:hypothetical protein
MRIFEHEQDGLTTRQPYELVDEGLQCAGPLLLWRQAQDSIASFGLQSKQRGKQGPVALAPREGFVHGYNPRAGPGLRVCCLGAVDMSVEGLWISVDNLTSGLDKLVRRVVIRGSTETPSQGVRASSQHHNLSGPL